MCNGKNRFIFNCRIGVAVSHCRTVFHLFFFETNSTFFSKSSIVSTEFSRGWKLEQPEATENGFLALHTKNI